MNAEGTVLMESAHIASGASAADELGRWNGTNSD